MAKQSAYITRQRAGEFLRISSYQFMKRPDGVAAANAIAAQPWLPDSFDSPDPDAREAAQVGDTHRGTLIHIRSAG